MVSTVSSRREREGTIRPGCQLQSAIPSQRLLSGSAGGARSRGAENGVLFDAWPCALMAERVKSSSSRATEAFEQSLHFVASARSTKSRRLGFRFESESWVSIWLHEASTSSTHDTTEEATPRVYHLLIAVQTTETPCQPAPVASPPFSLLGWQRRWSMGRSVSRSLNALKDASLLVRRHSKVGCGSGISFHPPSSSKQGHRQYIDRVAIEANVLEFVSMLH